MTSTKKPKKAKLRNTEYYDLQSLFDTLYAESSKGKQFNNLITTISSEENIKLAYRNIKKNKGSNTPGTDNKTISHLEKWGIDELVKHVQKKVRMVSATKSRKGRNT